MMIVKLLLCSLLAIRSAETFSSGDVWGYFRPSSTQPEEIVPVEEENPQESTGVWGWIKGKLYSLFSATKKIKTYTTTKLQSVTARTIDSGVTFLARQMQKFFISRNMDYINLPEVNTSFSMLGGFATVEFEAKNGTLGRLSSISRRGRANFTFDKLNMAITIPMTLSNISVCYNYYQLKGFYMSTNGSFSVTIESNEIDVKIRVSVDMGCVVNLEKVEIISIGGIQVHFTGICDNCGSAISYLSTKLAYLMEPIIKSQMQAALDTDLREFFNGRYFVCSKLITP